MSLFIKYLKSSLCNHLTITPITANITKQKGEQIENSVIFTGLMDSTKG